MAQADAKTVGSPPSAGPHKVDSFLSVPSHDDGYGSATSISSFDSSSSSSSEQKAAPSRPTISKTKTNRDSTPPLKKTPSSKTSSGFAFDSDFSKTKGKVSKSDGRLQLRVKELVHNDLLSKALGLSIQNHLDSDLKRNSKAEGKGALIQLIKSDVETVKTLSRSEDIRVPKMNIVIQVIGSRGDIQPFIKIGKILQERHGHRVRIATHPTFRDFVEKDCGLEFFSVGGDPSELMAFMVKNPGLLPNKEALLGGEVTRRREVMSTMFHGFFRSCVDPSDGDPGHTIDRSYEPFIADCIIANPPSFAHIHCAERLGVPLHMMFTFPYTATQSFPHPLANIKSTNVDANYTNYISYQLVDMITWQGLGDLVNRFRERIGLDPLSKTWAPSQLYRLRVPYTYMWSPALTPKPPDWGPEINIGGFVFLELASSFKPPEALAKFLEAGEAPVYIGFGSIVVDDPSSFTKMIFEAVKKAGVRALVNKGWGGFGGNEDTPDNIFMLDNTPHDWLFPRCKAVIHHGGAGTTAIGLKLAKPTMIVPFFGDQPFWGAMVATAKAGAHECIPYKELTCEKFAEGIKQCLEEEAQHNVQKIADSIAREGDGAMNAVKYFHASLPLTTTRNPTDHELRNDSEAVSRNLRCSILPDRVAVWKVRKRKLRLSAVAAEFAIRSKRLTYEDLKLYRQYDWNDFQGPITGLYGLGEAFGRGITGVGRGVGEGSKAISRDVRMRSQRRKRAKSRTKSESSDADSGIVSPPASTTPSLTSQTNLTESPRASADSSTTLTLPQTNETNLDHPHNSSTLPRDLANSADTSLSALARLPSDLFYGLSTGLHNTPKLWGDSTVRRHGQITGVSTGFKAAGQEAAFGIYDAVSGLVTQPYKGTKQDGYAGFAKGTAKGVAGFIAKQATATVGPIGYAMKGVQMEWGKRKSPMLAVQRARIEQGRREVDALSEVDLVEEQRRAKEGWETADRAEIEEHRRKSAVIGKIPLVGNRRGSGREDELDKTRGSGERLEVVQEGDDAA